MPHASRRTTNAATTASMTEENATLHDAPSTAPPRKNPSIKEEISMVTTSRPENASRSLPDPARGRSALSLSSFATVLKMNAPIRIPASTNAHETAIWPDTESPKEADTAAIAASSTYAPAIPAMDAPAKASPSTSTKRPAYAAEEGTAWSFAKTRPRTSRSPARPCEARPARKKPRSIAPRTDAARHPAPERSRMRSPLSRAAASEGTAPRTRRR